VLEAYYLASIEGDPQVNPYLTEEEAAEYNADPDAYAAKYLGFSSVDQYREYIESEFIPMCSERTRSGRLCRCNVAGVSGLNPAQWREHHRPEPCPRHGGPTRREREAAE
jgi:hypothetical protein